MNIAEKTKHKTLLLTTFILIVSFIIGYIFLNYKFQKEIDERVDKIAKSSQKLFSLKVKEEDSVLKIMLHRITTLDGLPKAISEKNYKKIDTLVAPYFKRFKKINSDMKILTFRSYEGITLYKAHKPEFYGDSLNKKRQLIIDTAAHQKTFSGFEVGKLTITYRVTEAIFYENRCVGTVELGISPNFFIKDLSAIFDMDIGMAIDKIYAPLMIEKGNIFIDDRYMLVETSPKLKEYFK